LQLKKGKHTSERELRRHNNQYNDTQNNGIFTITMLNIMNIIYSFVTFSIIPLSIIIILRIISLSIKTFVIITPRTVGIIYLIATLSITTFSIMTP
jgi:hypothetical protein